MATWKEMRALQAAARAAEAQRQTETARGAREARGLERTLGLVDQLIGLAPQAIEGYETGEARKILSGERGLEREKPKEDDILGQVGAFIASPFEEGVQRRAKSMAGRMAPERLQQVEPLLREAIQKPGMTPAMTPEEVKKQVTESKAVGGKFVEPTPRQLAPREAARAELMKDPSLSLLPQQQQEAAIAGLEQRMAAEQAAAERQKMLDEAKIAPKGGESSSKKNLVGAAKNVAIGEAAGLESQINIVGDPEATKQAYAQVRSVAEDAYRKAGGDPTSQDGMSDVFNITEEIYSKYRKKDFGTKDYDQILAPINLNDELVELDDLRKKVKFSPDEAQIVRQRIANADLKSFLVDVGEINRLISDLQLRGEITPDQAIYLNLSLQAKNGLIKAANDGYNVTNSDFSRLNSIVLDPMSSDEVWDGLLSGTLRKINKEAISRYNVVSSTVTAPAELASRVRNLKTPEIKLTGDQKKLAGESSEAAGKAVQQIIEFAVKTGAQAMGLPQLLDLAEKQNDGVLKKAAETVKSFFGMETAATTVPAASPAPAAVQPAPAAPAAPARPAPPPSEYEAPEIAYQRLKGGGQLEGRRFMLIVTFSNGITRYYSVEDTPADVDSVTAKLRKIDPNVTTQRYTGNDAGGL